MYLSIESKLLHWNLCRTLILGGKVHWQREKCVGFSKHILPAQMSYILDHRDYDKNTILVGKAGLVVGLLKYKFFL